MAEYGDHVDALFFDVVYNQNNSSDVNPSSYFLPLARHKSWYDGHSFASGLFPFADGKSMESSGESVNCYYGAYLWSVVRWGGDTGADCDMVNFMRLLLAMEIRSVRTYWHMWNQEEDKLNTDVYNPLFSKNLMVGNVGMMDVTVATWFGTKNLYVHM